MASRQKIHDWDVRRFGEESHQPACLAAHCSWYAESNTCSYRHQAYLKAKSAGTKYKWPAGVPGPRTPGAWDIGTAGNFQRKSSKPFWHESHHIVPNSELNKALADKDVREKLAGQGLVPVPMTAEEATRFVSAERAKWADVIKRSGAKLD